MVMEKSCEEIAKSVGTLLQHHVHKIQKPHMIIENPDSRDTSVLLWR